MAVPLHFALSPEPGCGGGKAAKLQQTLLQVASGSDVRLPPQAGGMLLRLWLGSGGAATGCGGWSQAVTLPVSGLLSAVSAGQKKQEPMLMVLHSSPAAAASAAAAGLASPLACAAQQQLGAVLGQLVPPDHASGQSTIHFWPPLLLRNETPCPLRLLLPIAQGTTSSNGPSSLAQLGQQLQPTQQEVLPARLVEVLLAPGASQQLMVPLQGGTVGALLALEAPASQASLNSSLVNGDTQNAAPDADVAQPPVGQPLSFGPGLALVVPPLIAETAEQQWFGSAPADRPGTPSAAAAAAPQAAVYIAPPGEAACMHLPLLLGGASRISSAPEGSAGCTAAEAAAVTSPRRASSGRGPIVLAGGSALMADCLLVTRQQSKELPLLQLVVVPALAVHNCLPVPLLFKVRLSCVYILR
jgi:hypothetical protein